MSLNSSMYFQTARGPDRGIETLLLGYVEVSTKVEQEPLSDAAFVR
jgi:hypothetical protein